MKLIHYKAPLLIATLMLLLNINAYADETAQPAATIVPGVAVKTKEAITHGAEATAQGIERGAKATVRGIEHGVKTVERGVKRGVEATAHGIERGAEATRNAAHAVVEKVQGKEYDEEPHPANEDADLNAK